MADELVIKSAEVEMEDDSSLSENVEFPLGQELEGEEVSEITRQHLTRLILVAGAPESGKTTLLTCIYELFQNGPVGEYLFAGSSTLPGFERRCHDARTKSEREQPETERTKPGFEAKYLHLVVRRRKSADPAQDLLFTDLSGENFELASNSEEDLNQLPQLRRADHFVLLVNSDRLARAEERHGAIQEAVALLRNCLDNRMLCSNAFVDVMFSKWDKVIRSQNSEEILAFVASKKREFIRRFQERLGRLRFSEIACRPDANSPLQYGHGIVEPFADWVQLTPFLQAANWRVDPNIEAGVREFDRFQKRWQLRHNFDHE